MESKNSLMNNKNCKDRDQLVKGLERKFNTVWYHLYKMMGDIELRKTAHYNPMQQKKIDNLTSIAKQRLRECADESPELPLGMKATKEKIEFIENGNYKPYNTPSQERYENRYKTLVLKEYGIKEESNPIIRNDLNEEIEKVIHLKQKRPSRSKFDTIRKDILNIIGANKMKKYLLKNNVTSPVKKNRLLRLEGLCRLKRSKTEIPIQTPYYAHAQATGKLTPHQENQINLRKQELESLKEKFMNTLYGKKKKSSPLLTTRNLFQNSPKKFIRTISDRTQAKPFHLTKTYTSLNNAYSTKSLGRINTMDKLIEDCDAMHEEVRKKFNSILHARRNIMGSFSKMQKSLNINLGNRGRPKSRRKFSDHKRVFIYGKDGRGRFINLEVKDTVKMGDILMSTKSGF